jgi:ribosomal protein S18 acetylase RimI-like enzyme
MSLDLLRQIEANSNAAAAQHREVVAVGPFRALLEPNTNTTWLNYAVPTSPLEDAAAAGDALGELRRVFDARGRRLRFEFNEGVWPDLPVLLERAGLQLQARYPLMACTFADLRDIQASGVRVRLLDSGTMPADLRAYLSIRNESFGLDTGPVSDEAVEAFRLELHQGHLRWALAEWQGEPAGVGYTVPLDGVARLGGVATKRALRRRGVAATLSSYLALDHFARGGRLVWLLARDEAAQAVYDRVGFRLIGERLNYVDGPA